MKRLWLLLYVCFARFLPATNSSIPFRFWIRRFRSYVACKCFESYGKNVNIESHANFGTGAKIRIGNNSNLGVRSIVRGPLYIGDDVMMGPDV